MTRIGGCLLAALVIAAAGCAAPQGDFGRPKANWWNDTALPMIGREAARARSEPVSYYMLTDDEKTLRDRSYRLVMPIHRRAFLARNRTELVRTRVWPDEMYRVDPTLFYRKEVAEEFRSSEARYNSLRSEILADRELLGPYYRAIKRVCRADAARLRALDETPMLTHEEEADAFGRVYENMRVIDWGLAALAWRVESYSYALERSRIEIPSKQDRSVSLTLGEFADAVAELEAAVARLDCFGGRQPPETGPAVVKR